MSATWAVFLDRDGVINEPVPSRAGEHPESPLHPRDVRLVPGAADALRALSALGVPLIVVSNQPAAAKGQCELQALHAVHDRVVELLAAEGVRIADYRYCLHHPDGSDPSLGGPCGCRKPAPGLLLAAARDASVSLPRSVMIGDTDADVGAGTAAGCRTVLVENPLSAHRRSDGAAGADHCVPDLAAAAAAVTRATTLELAR